MAFSLFNNFDRKVSKLYSGINPKMAPLMLPEGKDQLKNVLLSMDKLIGGNRPLKEIMSIYMNTCSRIITGMSQDHIYKSLINKHSGVITTENVYMVVSYVMINMKNPAFAIKTDEDIGVISSLAQTQKENIQIRKTNTELQKDQAITYNFGIRPDNPIYTNGIKGSDQYLSRLRTEKGERLKCERKGSLSLKGINGIVDQYDLFLPSGELYNTIYINMYCKENSTQAPNGLILIS